jgi:hypothetical protein
MAGRPRLSSTPQAAVCERARSSASVPFQSNSTATGLQARRTSSAWVTATTLACEWKHYLNDICPVKVISIRK